MDKSTLQRFAAIHVFKDIDRQFAELMVELSGGKRPESVFLASILAFYTTSQNRHTCLDLKRIAGKPLSQLFPTSPGADDGSLCNLTTPLLKNWLEDLSASPVVGKPGEYKPLVLDRHHRLYLYRYWEYEQNLAASIRNRLNRTTPVEEMTRLRKSFQSLFKNNRTFPDWQKIAAFMAVRNGFCVISGGPGTGKTYTVSLILRLLFQHNPSLNITLAAPTGKAATRLMDSLSQANEAGDLMLSFIDQIPSAASTIHRLLKVVPGTDRFVHNESNPLVGDLFIIDEASMVSLALMSKLFQAIPTASKVILLGDKNQLSSVEAGAVFGDISEAGKTDFFSKDFVEAFHQVTGDSIPVEAGTESERTSPFHDCIVELKHNYRFDASPGIGILSGLINRGEMEETIDSLSAKKLKNVSWRDLPPLPLAESLVEEIVEKKLIKGFRAKSMEKALEHHNRFKILCSHRLGDYGVTTINRQVEEILVEKQVVDFAGAFYKGKPIIIKENDYGLGLYNGDTGIIWDDSKGALRAFFRDKNDQFKSYSPGRLPAHKSVYAMTIHESQGSEFDDILIILPAGNSAIFTRELLYTAITRAKNHVEIRTARESLAIAVNNKTSRYSGLQDMLKLL